MSDHVTSSLDFSQATKQLLEAASKGLHEAAALVLQESQQEVPYLSHELQRSGHSGLVHPDRAAVTYTSHHAVAVHEDLRSHRQHGRSAKFLENAVNRSRTRVLAILAREARRGLD